MQELTRLGGYTHYFNGILKNQEGVLWYHTFQIQTKSSDAQDVEELTRVDVRGRKRVRITYEFMRKYMLGYEKSFSLCKQLPNWAPRGKACNRGIHPFSKGYGIG
jgi:hypothetical protein